MVGVTVEAVQLGLSFAEIDVDTGLGKTIIACDRRAQLPRINTNLARKLVEQKRADKITIVNKLCRIAMTRIDDSQAVFSEKGGVTNQPGGDRRRRLIALEHRQHEVMVRNCFIDEAPARR